MQDNTTGNELEPTCANPPDELNPEIDSESPKTSNLNPNTNMLQTERKSKSPALKSPAKDNSPPKNNIEDEMEKYFEEYGVMQSIPSSKKLHAEVKTLKKEKKKQQASDEDQSNIDEEELYRYKQLENKLNVALNKIQICKDSSVKSLKMKTEDVDEMYKRFEHYEKKKQQQIERRKQERQEEELRELKKKPIINPASSKIVGSIEPIYERYERVLTEKQKWLQEQRQKIKKEKEREEEQFFKKFEERNRRPENARSTEVFYQQLLKWKQKKTQRNREKLQIQEKEQMVEATFQPTINQRSKKLVAKKPERQPIFTRQPKPRPVVQEYTFMPRINKKVPSYR